MRTAAEEVTGILPVSGSTRPIVIVESPYASGVHLNITYLKRALRHSWEAGELPWASHAYFPFFVSETKEREAAISASYRFWQDAKLIAFYTDLGFSPGMTTAFNRAQMLGLKVEMRSIGAHE